MKVIYYLLCLCLFFSGISAQTISVKGALKDTAANQPLKFASVQLLRAKDSVLVTFTRTDATGHFQTKNVQPGNYILVVTYPKYADYADIINLQKDEDVGQLALLTQATALQNVIVRGGGAIRLRGDTTAFMADSFKVREGATVEDLLKRIPGFSVNKKGEITAQGEKVEKVLVDGEEFFGDDPTMATQNLQAAAVKEVQLFDKKSDQAAFTGVDDGQKTKTINLKLKDEAKRGYFGKLNLGGGLPGTYDNKVLVNAFRSKRKISGFAQMSNTGNGLSWSEDQNYGGSINTTTIIGDDGSININGNGDEFGGPGGYYGQGLPRNWSTGLNFSNKMNGDKDNLNGTYRYQKLNTNGTVNTNTQYILPSPDTSYSISETNRFYNSRERHKARGIYDITVDSMNTLKFTADGSTGKSSAYNEYSRQTLSADSMLINQQARTTKSNTNTTTFNTSGLWRKKFAKLRRTLSISFTQTYNKSNGDNFLKSNERYYSRGQVVKDTLTDQMKVSNSQSFSLESKASYTEPVSKNAIIEFNYGYGLRNSENQLNSFDNENGKYEKLNILTSNDYRFNTQTHSVGANYALSTKKVKFGFGGNVARSIWNQDDLRKDTSRNYQFNNFFPRANFSYMFSKQSSLRFTYDGRTRAPSLDQIQPLVNNLDPLNIAIGNPNLKQSFNQNYRLTYNNYKVLTERNIYVSANFSPTNNAFSSSDRIDSGRRYYQTVNVSGNYSGSMWSYFGFKLKKLDLSIGTGPSISISRNRNFVNGKLNTTNSQSFSIGPEVRKYVDKKYNFYFEPQISYNISKSSVQPELSTKYWGARMNADGGVQLPKDFYLNTDIDYSWRQRTPIFTQNNTTFRWNADLEKKIFKKKTASIHLKVYDILNLNRGIDRDIESNYIRQTNYQVLSRYALLSFIWNFSKNGKAPEDNW